MACAVLLRVLHFGSNGAEFWGKGGFGFGGRWIVGYELGNRGATSSRGHVLQVN